MLRILLGSGLLFMVSLIGITKGQIYSNQGYQSNVPSNPLFYDSPLIPKPNSISGYRKETPAVPFFYPTSAPKTTPIYRPVTTLKSQGYPKETPAVSFTYPTATSTTTRPTISRTTTTRPTTAKTVTTTKFQGYPKEIPAKPFTYPTAPPTTRPTTPTTRTFRTTTPKPTTARIVTITKSQGYPKETPAKPFTYPTAAPTTRPTTRPTTPRTTTYRTTTPKPTTARIVTTTKSQGYPKETPAKPFTYPTAAPTTRLTTRPTTPRTTTYRTTTPKPTTARIVTITKSQGYPKETPAKPFTYPTAAPTTRLTTRPTTPRTTTFRTTTPKPTTARIVTTTKSQGYPKETPAKPFTYPTAAPTTRLTTRPTTPRTTTFRTTTPKPTTARIVTTTKSQGYPKETPAKPFTYPTAAPSTRPTTRPTTPRTIITRPTTTRPTTARIVTITKSQGYPKETPAKPFTYPTAAPTTRPTTRPTTPRTTTYKPTTTPPTTARIATTTKSQGYPKDTPAKPFTYPTTAPTTSRTTRPTTPRTTTTRLTTPRSTPARIITTTKSQGYPKETPALRLTYPTPSPSQTTPFKSITPIPTTSKRTTVKQQGYPKESPSVPFTYPTSSPTLVGYPKSVPANPLAYQSPVEPSSNLFGASSNQQIYKSKFEEDFNGQGHNQLSGASHTSKNVVNNNVNSGSSRHHGNDNNDQQWDLRKAVPGEPEVDYPILNSVPTTSFSCEGRIPGYYADMESRCQTFHVCSAEPPGMQKTSFLCPNGSVFNQELFTCDWWVNVNCAASEKYYSLNSEIGRLRPGLSPSNVMHPPPLLSFNGSTVDSSSFAKLRTSSLPSEMHAGPPDERPTTAFASAPSVSSFTPPTSLLPPDQHDQGFEQIIPSLESEQNNSNTSSHSRVLDSLPSKRGQFIGNEHNVVSLSTPSLLSGHNDNKNKGTFLDEKSNSSFSPTNKPELPFKHAYRGVLSTPRPFSLPAVIKIPLTSQEVTITQKPSSYSQTHTNIITSPNLIPNPVLPVEEVMSPFEPPSVSSGQATGGESLLNPISLSSQPNIPNEDQSIFRQLNDNTREESPFVGVRISETPTYYFPTERKNTPEKQRILFPPLSSRDTIGVQPQYQTHEEDVSSDSSSYQKLVYDSSLPQVIKSVGYSLNTPEGQEEFARAVASGLLGDIIGSPPFPNNEEIRSSSLHGDTDKRTISQTSSSLSLHDPHSHSTDATNSSPEEQSNASDAQPPPAVQHSYVSVDEWSRGESHDGFETAHSLSSYSESQH